MTLFEIIVSGIVKLYHLFTFVYGKEIGQAQFLTRNFQAGNKLNISRRYTYVRKENEIWRQIIQFFRPRVERMEYRN